ncbi:hypothetical protein CANINC_003046 [Pichia inconspicua]|uniref:chitin synthase n=1 Tax=Pichia inconspicua TaxID=52247 RepID=A0A4T0X0U4_9ASCO|nr:hypothetical protein CANINC_003046 [[Candida] inconspicua]
MPNDNPFAFDDDESDSDSFQQNVLDLYHSEDENQREDFETRLQPPPVATRASMSPRRGDHGPFVLSDEEYGIVSEDESTSCRNSADDIYYEKRSIPEYEGSINTQMKSSNIFVDEYDTTNGSAMLNTSNTNFLSHESIDYKNAYPVENHAYYQTNRLGIEDEYYGDHSSSNFFQPFERDQDEPELDNNALFEDQEAALKTDIQQTNFADKCDNKVELIDGKYYSFDYPIPDQLLKKIPFEGAKKLTEFTHVRYHAITSDPKDYSADNFAAREYVENYPLRQNLYSVKRETELMIVCTMYNEDEVLLGRTLKGIFKNIKTMYNLRENPDEHPWGRDSWKKIVVVIVSDGKNKINIKSKALLTLLGTFQEGIMQEYVNDDFVNGHLFEYTTTFGIGKFNYNWEKKAYNVPLVTEQTVPVQLMFLLKTENKQKINSHRWALNFLCPNLNPKVVILLDVGTEPGPDSIYKLWKAFKDPNIGGACGEIRAMLGNHASPNDESSIIKKMVRSIYFTISDFWTCIINPLIAAQNFEYKMSNILDKPMESAFGFVTVLPGAFSAYRYEALKGEPLRAYFHGEDMKSNNEKPAGILESNMYLAEDRILCFELVTKSDKSYLLKYVHNAFAVTDVPNQINEFVNQRRRWLNGSFFAALYSILHFYRILISTHSIGRKINIIIEMIYQTINILLSWFALSTYFLVFRILSTNVGATFIGENTGKILSIVFLWVYIAAIVLTFIISFGNKPNDAKYMYLLGFSLFGTIAIYMMFCVACLTYASVKGIQENILNSQSNLPIVLQYFKNAKFRDLTISLASTYVLYIISSAIFFDMFHIFACVVQYILLSPAYINVLGIFAFCNINDISWGTKGALTNEQPKRRAIASGKEGEGEKQVLILSDSMGNPDELYKTAQELLVEGEIKEEKSFEEIEREKISLNIKKSEKNYALGRTYTVLIWLISNFILLVVILRTGGLEEYSEFKNSEQNNKSKVKRDYWNDNNVANTFMTVILWLVAGLALFRLIGCIYYRISFFINERRFHRKMVI